MAGSLLEAFFFSFSADTSAVREGIDAGRTGAENLNETLNQTDETAGRIGQSFIELAKSAGALIAGTLAFGAIKAMTVASAEATNQLADQARELRINANELQAWQKANINAGGSAESFNATLKMLNERYRDPQKGLEQLTKTAERFKGLNDSQADRLGESLGLDKGTIEMMRQGSVAMAALVQRQKELSTVTQEELDVAQKFKQQMNDTNTVYDDVRRKIATQILPVFTSFLGYMQDITIWARDNKWFVLGFFGAVAALILTLYLPSIIAATTATLAFLAPYILLGAAIAVVAGAFALAYDDVMNFLAGNKSLIGELEKKYPIIGDIVRGLADAFSFLWQAVKLYVQLIIDFFTKGPQEAFSNFSKAANGILDGLAERFPHLASVFELMGRVITSVADIAGKGWGLFFEGVKVGIDMLIEGFKMIASVAVPIAKGIGSILNKGAGIVLDLIGPSDKSTTAAASPAATSESAKQLVSIAKVQVSEAAAAPTNAQTSNSITNSSNRTSTKNTNVNIPNVTINTQSTSAEEIAKGFTKGLGEQLRNAQGQFDDGVVA